MQINQACTKFLNGYFSTHERREKTKKAYCSDLKQFQEFVESDLDVSLLRSSHIESWAAHLRQKDYSPASIRRKIVVLKVFCSYWVRTGVMPESPFWRVKISYGRIEQLPRTLTEIEMKGLLTQAQQDRSIISRQRKKRKENSTMTSKSSSQDYRTLRNLALLELLFATGMRVGEVSSIDIKDFLAEEDIFRIKGKGGRERLAFIVDEVTLKILREHLEARMRIETENPALFLNATGKRISTQGIAKIITKLREDGGIKRHVTPHMLRHTVATLLLRNGVDIRIVQEFLGHASIATTQRYVHIVKEHMIRELRNRHPSLNLRMKTKNLPK
ncbi:MAG: tyrosine-type recombinase/integrase [Chitinophagaceae bacterium]|nr:tyrosine-type recombinase/integrase [Chitinophagaceae bacterium]